MYSVNDYSLIYFINLLNEDKIMMQCVLNNISNNNDNFDGVNVLLSGDKCKEYDIFLYKITKIYDANFKPRRIQLLIDMIDKTLKNICIHSYIHDYIDVDPEYSQMITYCDICFLNK